MQELEPPAERPPALATDEAEALRAKARAAYDDIRALNPTLIPPAKFGNQIRNAEHSIEALRNTVASFEALRDTEQEIVDATAKLLDLYEDDAEVDKVLAATARMSARTEIRDHLQDAVNRALDELQAEAEADQTDGDEAKGGDES